MSAFKDSKRLLTIFDRQPFPKKQKRDVEVEIEKIQEAQIVAGKRFGKPPVRNLQDNSHLVTTYNSIIDFWNKDVQLDDMMDVDPLIFDFDDAIMCPICKPETSPDEFPKSLKRKRRLLESNCLLSHEDLVWPSLKNQKIVEQVEDVFHNSSFGSIKVRESCLDLIERGFQDNEYENLPKVFIFDFTFAFDNILPLDVHDSSKWSCVSYQHKGSCFDSSRYALYCVFNLFGGIAKCFPFDPGSKWNSIDLQNDFEDNHVTWMIWLIAWIFVLWTNDCFYKVMEALFDPEHVEDVSVSSDEDDCNQIELTLKHLVIKNPVRRWKRVWEIHGLFTGSLESTPKKAKNDGDFNQLVSQHHHFKKLGNLFTPQTNELVNIMNDYAGDQCHLNCLRKLLVVVFVLSRLSTKKFLFSRSMIDNLKKCWISLDTDHEIYDLVCSCHLRLFIPLLHLFFEYHSNILIQLNNAKVRAYTIHELTLLISILRSIWVRNQIQTYDDANSICHIRLSLLYVMFIVYFSITPTVEYLVAIMATSDLICL